MTHYRDVVGAGAVRGGKRRLVVEARDTCVRRTEETHNITT